MISNSKRVFVSKIVREDIGYREELTNTAMVSVGRAPSHGTSREQTSGGFKGIYAGKVPVKFQLLAAESRYTIVLDSPLVDLATTE